MHTGWGLGRFRLGDEAFAGLVVGERVLDLRTVPEDGLARDGLRGTSGLLGDWRRQEPVLDRAARRADGTWHDLAGLQVLAPVDPRQVIQAGANYRKHVVEIAVAHTDLAAGRTPEQVRAETAAMMDERKAHGEPYLFLGLPSAVTGPYDEVVLPAGSAKHDWELELAAVIGTEAYRLDPADALDAVAGYVIVNDLTTRDLVFRRDMPEIGTDWFRAKNSPGFLPVGPWIVPASQVPDPQQLHLTLRLNGEVMQDESAQDMLFGVAELVAAASRTARLGPGDLVLTGSPAGNGAAHGRLLRHGDVMESTITGLGTQRTRVVSESA